MSLNYVMCCVISDILTPNIVIENSLALNRLFQTSILNISRNKEDQLNEKLNYDL